MHKPRLLYYLLMTASLQLMAAGEASAQINREYQVKAVYLYHFLRLAPWATPVNAPPRTLKIGILGDNPFRHSGGDHLRAITTVRKVNGRSIEVETLNDDDDIDCDLLFIRKNPRARQRLTAALQKIGNRQVLIVTENPGLAEHGAMVNFAVLSNRIRLELNSAAARDAKLTFRREILELKNATDVSKATNGRNSSRKTSH